MGLLGLENNMSPPFLISPFGVETYQRRGFNDDLMHEQYVLVGPRYALRRIVLCEFCLQFEKFKIGFSTMALSRSIFQEIIITSLRLIRLPEANTPLFTFDFKAARYMCALYIS